MAENIITPGISPERKNPAPTLDRKRYLAPTVIALLCATIFVAAFPDIKIPNQEYKTVEAFTQLAHAENEKSEMAGITEISDYAPMFIPTRWNFTKQISELPTPQGWNVENKNYEKLAEVLHGEQFPLYSDGDMARGRENLLRSIMRSVFSSYKRVDMPADTYKATASIKLIDMSDGKVFMRIPIDDKLPMISIAQFRVSVEYDGDIPSAVLIETTGSDDMDKKFLNTLSLLKNIPKGNYRALFVP